MGNFEEAKEAYETARSLYKDLFGTSEPEVSFILSEIECEASLADIALLTGDTKSQMELLENILSTLHKLRPRTVSIVGVVERFKELYT